MSDAGQRCAHSFLASTKPYDLQTMRALTKVRTMICVNP